MDLTKLLLKQVEENMKTIQLAKSNTCKFGTLLLCIFFYVQKFSPSVSNVDWSTDKLVTLHIIDLIKSLGDTFNSLVDSYYEQFKERMNSWSRIPRQLVEEYEHEISFLVDIDFTLIKAIELRRKWLAPMGYELDIYFASKSIKALLAEPKDPKAKRFGTYEEGKARIKIGLVIGKITKKSRKMMTNFG